MALPNALLLGLTNPLLHYLDLRMQFRGKLTSEMNPDDTSDDSVNTRGSIQTH